MRVVWYVLTLVVLDLMIVDMTKEVAGASHYNMQFQIPSLGLISMVEGPRALIPRKSPQSQGKSPQVFMQCTASATRVRL